MPDIPCALALSATGSTPRVACWFRRRLAFLTDAPWWEGRNGWAADEIHNRCFKVSWAAGGFLPFAPQRETSGQFQRRCTMKRVGRNGIGRIGSDRDSKGSCIPVPPAPSANSVSLVLRSSPCQRGRLGRAHPFDRQAPPDAQKPVANPFRSAPVQRRSGPATPSVSGKKMTGATRFRATQQRFLLCRRWGEWPLGRQHRSQTPQTSTKGVQ